MNNTHFIFLIFLSTLLSCNQRVAKLTQSEMGLSNFDLGQEKFITEGAADQAMRVWKINIPSDSLLLRQKSTHVTPDPKDATLKLMTERLLATVQDSMSLGVGIAAPQVGILKNIIWIQRFDKPDFPFEVYLNPVIKQYSVKKQACMEGCLSIPNIKAETQNRAYAILLEYDKMDGSHVIEMVEDFTAVIFQHEIDHLNGIMFTDHLEEE
jgi:peptide deformylase